LMSNFVSCKTLRILFKLLLLSFQYLKNMVKNVIFKYIFTLANVLPSNFWHSFCSANPTIFSKVVPLIECPLNDNMINLWPWLHLGKQWYFSKGDII
jgi:hypothetical protein